MAEECVVAVYADAAQAKSAIERLVASGFPQQNISLVTKSLRAEPAIVKQSLNFGDQAEHDALIGAGIGGVIGALGGGSVVVAMGMGVLIAGPAAALTGVIVGGLIGSIAGWSVHKSHLERYEAKAKAGKVLVIAHGSDPQKVAEAEVTLHQTHPEELHLHAKVDDADDRRVDDL
jgi:predicted lipid-binding transport protein (Tim44 family)